MTHDETMKLLPLLGPVIYLLLRKVRSGGFGLPDWATPWVALSLGVAGGALHAVVSGRTWSEAGFSMLNGLISGAVAIALHETVKTPARKADDGADQSSPKPPTDIKDIALRVMQRTRAVGAVLVALAAIATFAAGASACTATQGRTVAALLDDVCQGGLIVLGDAGAVPLCVTPDLVEKFVETLNPPTTGAASRAPITIAQRYAAAQAVGAVPIKIAATKGGS